MAPRSLHPSPRPRGAAPVSPGAPIPREGGGGPRDTMCRRCLLCPRLAAAPGVLGGGDTGWGPCCGAVPPVRVGCVAGAVCRARARVRGRLGAVTVRRWLRGEGWHGGAWAVGLSLRPLRPSVRGGSMRRLRLSLWRGVTGRGPRKSMALFCSLADRWALDAPKDEAAGAKQRAQLGWGGGCLPWPPVLGPPHCHPHQGMPHVAPVLAAVTTDAGC